MYKGKLDSFLHVIYVKLSLIPSQAFSHAGYEWLRGRSLSGCREFTLSFYPLYP